MPILLLVFPVGWTFLSDHRLKGDSNIPIYANNNILAFLNPASRDGQAGMPVLLLVFPVGWTFLSDPRLKGDSSIAIYANNKI